MDDSFEAEMDANLKAQMDANLTTFKNSLERIIDTYSKFQYQDEGLDVDLDSTSAETLEHYMNLSRAELNKLKSKSLTNLREESLRAKDVTKDSQLDFTYEDVSDNDTCVSTAQLSMGSDGTTSNDTTRLSVSSLDKSQGYLSEMDIQPEDQDEELEMSLRSQGSSLVELYPSMISRIGRAWHLQHVSEAADSVLRKYRRWRLQSNRSHLNNTFVVTQRNASRKPNNMTSKAPLKEKTRSPMNRQFKGPGASPRSPLHVATNMQERQAQQISPWRVRREQPVLVMDFSGPSHTSMLKGSSLNETFTVSEEQPSTYKSSPSQPRYPTANVSLDQSLRSRRLSLTAHSPQTGGCPAYASEIRPKPHIYGSPHRQSPSQARMMNSFSRSLHGFSRSPKAHSFMENFGEPLRPRLSTTPQKPAVPLRMLHPQDPQHSHRTPRSAAAEGPNRLRRHLSFDSSMQHFSGELSPKTVDEEFIKLYHRFVCQNKSSVFNRHPCRFCAKSSKVTRGSSSSALAALALSPHRSLLRKRHRELDWDSNPQSKRCREEYCPSPGSKRHRGETLRRCLSEYEQSHDALSDGSTRPSMFRRVNTLRCSAADFSGMGSSLESRLANSFSPGDYNEFPFLCRKW